MPSAGEHGCECKTPQAAMKTPGKGEQTVSGELEQYGSVAEMSILAPPEFRLQTRMRQPDITKPAPFQAKRCSKSGEEQWCCYCPMPICCR